MAMAMKVMVVTSVMVMMMMIALMAMVMNLWKYRMTCSILSVRSVIAYSPCFYFLDEECILRSS